MIKVQLMLMDVSKRMDNNKKFVREARFAYEGGNAFTVTIDEAQYVRLVKCAEEDRHQFVMEIAT